MTTMVHPVPFDPPAVTVAEIKDLAAVNEDLRPLEQDAMTLQSMPLQARRVIVHLGAATVVYHSTNLRVRTRTTVHDGLLACVVFGPHAAGTVEGLPVRPGMMVLAQPGTEVGFVAEPGYESIALLVPPGDLQEYMAARGWDGESRSPRRVDVLWIGRTQARALFRWGKRLTATASRQPVMFGEGRPEREAARVELLEMLRAATHSIDALEPVGADRTRQSHSRIVRIAEDYMLARSEEHVHVSDLCRATGVSERTLEYAFKEVVGQSPVAYLTRMRLHRVRAALVAGRPGSTRVSAEALRWGFWHFGEFSRAYRRCFGESPSETLKRPPSGP
jgi:AraC family transcriptional regulator, ethanolamine operon transcriptional activator